MHRRFETSTTRGQQYLDGPWAFVPDPDEEGIDAGYAESFPDDADTVTIPAPWQVRPEYSDYHGVAWYRRSVTLSETTTARLTFDAVGHDATVYVDGDEIASHYGGYTPFTVVLDDLAAGTHSVVVRADSTMGEETIPQEGADWFPYGGIYRDVLLESVPDAHVDDLNVRYDLDGDRADVSATVSFRNVGDPVERDLSVTVAGVEATDTVTVDRGVTTETVSLSVEGIDRWDVDDPTLYDVVVRLGEDELRDRIGFREIAVDGRDILLNGDAVTIAGVNRHEDHPEWGHAQPARLQERDIEILKRANLNAVRTSHYPNHPRFLDMCDEAGILVIEEIPYWQYDEDDFAKNVVLERGERMLVEMIERDRHHPSIFAWSLHNECQNHEDGLYPATETLRELALDHDESRLITLASVTDFRGHEEPLFELCDFYCVNGYWGWYDDDQTWADFLDRIEKRYDEAPIVMSEFGAGAVEGERTFRAQKWSETYQRDLLEDAVSLFLDRESIAGFTIWQYCDTLTSPENTHGRPKMKNNKGIVGEYRRPKDAYWNLKALLEKRL